MKIQKGPPDPCKKIMESTRTGQTLIEVKEKGWRGVFKVTVRI